MRNPKDGVALAAIVAKETTTGEWSGSGGGLGLGSGGIGFFVGGVSGTHCDQTQRAKDFEGPQETSYSQLNVYGPMLGLLAVAVLIRFCAGVASTMAEDTAVTSNSDQGPLNNLPNLLSGVLDFFGNVVPVLACLGAIGWFVFCSYGRHKSEAERVEREEAKTKIRKKIYYRLRYVENDHIVFDPESFEEVPAEREAITALITKIANKQLNKPANRK
ncbi:TPA: hypothetical protein MN540_005083 [Klebsiella pneumoniae]|nr:hypothetical protein [Klebsiella pneumoniae]